MKSRVIFHLIVFAVLACVGAWIAYQGVVTPILIGRLNINMEFAAIYWFTLLVYGFVCLVLYYPLRKRAWSLLLAGHAIAAAIALASTFTVVTLGARNNSGAHAVPSGSTLPPASDVDPAGPDVLPLPLPSRQNPP